MSTKIQWADETWNIVTGCDPDDGGQSEACLHCYARRMSRRLAGRYGYPESPNSFHVTFHPDKLWRPTHWKKPKRIFVCSMGDLLHSSVTGQQLIKVWRVMEAAHWHTFMVLTKRPEQMLIAIDKLQEYSKSAEWPLPNLWVGVTAENQKRYDERIPILMQIPAAVRFVSLEPLLSGIDMRGNLPDWCIAGRETGPGARPMDPDWARSIRDQCGDVPFFFKNDEPADLAICRGVPG